MPLNSSLVTEQDSVSKNKNCFFILKVRGGEGREAGEEKGRGEGKEKGKGKW